jgi:multidrug efflux pump subunit AcrA (membrane-fusion protein)
MAPLDGRLVRISPDVKIDEGTRQAYYEVRIEVEPEMLDRLAADVEMTPGMPAEVFILTGEQSLFSYIAAPVARSFRKAFREE